VLTPADFLWGYECAAEAGLERTVHAGEICGAQSVRDALDSLPISRIGHGVRAIEDPALVERLAEDEIVLEVNPGSNMALGVFADWALYPITRLHEAGVKVTISTDDPPYFHTDLSREYAALARYQGWDEDAFRAQNRTAIGAAFCDDETRSKIEEML